MSTARKMKTFLELNGILSGTRRTDRNGWKMKVLLTKLQFEVRK
jgi:hypothetical protein